MRPEGSWQRRSHCPKATGGVFEYILTRFPIADWCRLQQPASYHTALAGRPRLLPSRRRRKNEQRKRGIKERKKGNIHFRVVLVYLCRHRRPGPHLPRAITRPPLAHPIHLPSPRGVESPSARPCISQKLQNGQGRSLVIEKQPDGRRSRVFPLAGLPDASPQLFDLGLPSPALDEQVMAWLSLAAAAPPGFV